MKFIDLKNKAGSHSPSIALIRRLLPKLNINVDACFLSNPYATDLFYEYFQKDLIDSNKLRDVLEYYPSQNKNIAEFLSKVINVSPENLLIGNGAIQLIEELLVHHLKGKVGIPIPTFSSYYEILPEDRVHLINLKKANGYKLMCADIIDEINYNDIKIMVLINPNNPTGHFIENAEIEEILKNCPCLDYLIVDESFIHFTNDGVSKIETYFDSNANLEKVIGIKSLSKDFGIAGIRAGYAILNEKLRNNILKQGFLWNSNGIAEYFFELYSRPDFIFKYEMVLNRYLEDKNHFFKNICTIDGLKILPSSANFFLVEILTSKTSDDIVEKMLFDHGVYVRTCSDKIGLEGEYLRIASRSKTENEQIFNALKKSI